MDTQHIKAAYEPRILAHLTAIGAALTAAGFRTDAPVDLSSDEYLWMIDVWKPGNVDGESDASLDFKIMESSLYEGTDDGITFGTQAMLNGGNCLGVVQPFNFTPVVWVPLADAAALEARFRLVEQVPPAEWVRQFQDYDWTNTD